MITNNVLSLFDGISVGQLALNDLGIRYNTYYASEIEKPSIKITMKHFPKTIQLGDVTKIDGTKLQDIKLIIGGSPCKDFSIMGRKKGMTTNENIIIDNLEKYLSLKNNGFKFTGQSYLFLEFVRLWKETNAKYFFLENVSMDEKWEKIITDTLGVKPIEINSSCVIPQNRVRLYWTNIPNVSIPENKGLVLSDVIPDAVSGGGYRGIPDKSKPKKEDGKYHYVQNFTVRNDNLANCLVTSISTTGKYVTKNGDIKTFTPEEAELLQTLDKGYTYLPDISPSARYKMIGNSWTKNVITHLFKGLITKKNKYNLFFR